MATHSLLHEAKRQAEKLGRYRIRRTNYGCFRLWRLYDEWKPIQEFASQEAGEDYLMAKLPPL